MKTTNLQLRKMNLIEYLPGIPDEKVFKNVEEIIHKNFKSINPADIVLSKENLIKRAEFSNKQIKKGHTLTQKELEQQSKNW